MIADINQCAKADLPTLCFMNNCNEIFRKLSLIFETNFQCDLIDMENLEKLFEMIENLNLAIEDLSQDMIPHLTKRRTINTLSHRL